MIAASRPSQMASRGVRERPRPECSTFHETLRLEQSMNFSLRDWLKTAAISAAGVLVARPGSAADLLAPTPITVYKTASCGCCKEWVAHLKKNNFAPTVHDLPDLADTKSSLGVPSALQS